MIPPAAVAVLRAAYEDATRRAHTPRQAAQAAARALRRAGWTITPTGGENAPQAGTQSPAAPLAPHTHTR